MSPTDITPIDIVAAHIARRYGNPGRAAFLYLFRLKPGSEFEPLTPDLGAIEAAWVDEGQGLISADAAQAVALCAAARNKAPDLQRPKKLGATQRRQMMARSVLFSVQQVEADLVQVRLLSRSLVFTPKGDREANEVWRPAAGDWFSAYREHSDEDE